MELKGLTIIVPVYNVEQYIQRCFDSILKLDWEKLQFEVIFVNDGSTDKSLQMIETWEQEYAFVRVISQHNQGLSAARNTGIQAAKGQYFLLLDSDDWLEGERVGELLQIAQDNSLDLVGFKLQFVDEAFQVTGAFNQELLIYNQLTTGHQALIDGFQPSSACLFLYNTAFIRAHNLFFSKGIMQEDVEFTVRLLLSNPQLYFQDAIVYNYYRRSDSMTTTNNKSRKEKYLLDSIEVAYLMKNNLNSNIKYSAALKKAIVQNYNSVVWNLLWRFYRNKKEVDFSFKLQCLQQLKELDLYPIKGALKTKFQIYSSILMNNYWIFTKLINQK